MNELVLVAVTSEPISVVGRVAATPKCQRLLPLLSCPCMLPQPLRRTPLLTYEDYRLLPEDGPRYELIEGELYLSPSPSTRHQTVSRRLQYALMKALEDPGLAQVFNAPMDLVVDRNTAVQPDLIIVGTARTSIITARALEGAPDVVVEILSPSTRDRDEHIKRRLYERFGVREYWLVDSEAETLIAYRRDDEGYGIRASYDRTGILECPEFPSLSLVLADVFR